MIKQFDVMNFLEDTGLPKHFMVLFNGGPCQMQIISDSLIAAADMYVEGMEETDEEPDVVERKWLRPIYKAAPTLVHR